MSTIVADSIEPKTTGGAVTFPNRPMFAVRGYGTLTASIVVNGVTVSTPGHKVITGWTTTDQNVGSHFDNTTGKFTCPVAGIYQINAGVGLKASTNYLAIALFLTPDDGAGVGYLNAYGNNDNYHSVPGCSTLIKATAGQEFAMAITDQYSTPNTAAHYCWFNACLVG
jgi:hypothetical protein